MCVRERRAAHAPRPRFSLCFTLQHRAFRVSLSAFAYACMRRASAPVRRHVCVGQREPSAPVVTLSSASRLHQYASRVRLVHRLHQTIPRASASRVRLHRCARQRVSTACQPCLARGGLRARTVADHSVHALWRIVCTTSRSCAQPVDCVHRGCARSDRVHTPWWIVCAVGGREWPAVEMRHLPADQLAASDWMVKGQVVSRAEVLETFVRDALTDVTKIKVRPCVCAM